MYRLKEFVMSSRQLDERRVRRLIALGFLLMIILLLADGFFGFRSLRSIKHEASQLVEDQLLQMTLIDETQREQGSLSAIFYLLAGDPDSLDRAQILKQIEATEQNIKRIVANVPAETPGHGTWNRLGVASVAFAAEARRLLALDNAPSLQSRELLRRHEEVITSVTRLIHLSHRKARAAKDRIGVASTNQMQGDLLLLGGCLVVAFACAFLVLQNATRLYRTMTEQSEELTKVSWQLLDNQEMMARRLSHEIHDELGQALTALKTNFTRHASSNCVDPAWMQDCSELLRDSIRSAHEISQLLRPTILDDFGLDSALNWLCERFGDRSGIEVEYTSSVKARLSLETETHLFRIAQEALTNVSRHSGASMVGVNLAEDHGRVHLSIRDNGKGLPTAGRFRAGSLGITGMRARARSAKGELTIRSGPGEGVLIEVWVPLETRKDEEKDPHPVG